MAAAAADASRSADSYIGSFISLTSKSEIRYEGVLYNINTEESSIGLRNVRAFGTEGRKKDGPQVPPSDKVYKYILFRGSDIKDLQVKSSPPTPPAPAVHSDPAIIQSHYPRPTPASTGLPFNGNRYEPDVISQTGQTAIPRAVFQGGLPLYQPPGAPGGLSSWGPSPALPNADGSGSGMPMYWQGVYAPGGHSQLQQPPILHPHGLQMPTSMQQPLQYPGMTAPSMLPFSTNLSGMEASSSSVPLNLPAENSSVPTVASSFPRTSSSLFTSAASLSSMVLPSSVPSAHATNVASEIPPPPSLNTRFAASLPETTVPANLPFISSIPKPDMDFISNKTAPIPGSNVSYQGIAHSVPASTMGLPSFSQEESLAPALVTPAQLLHGSSSISSSQLLQSSPEEAEKKLKAVETSEEAFTESKIAVVESDGPILPITPDQKINGVSLHTVYGYNHHRNKGRGRGRGNELARSATKFTEDFDFNAMNEKFNKEEIWGHLGKSKGPSRERDKDRDEYADNGILEEPAAGSLKARVKPVYDKNDFFDTLSCHSLDHANRFSRANMSGQQRIDFEAHDLQRHYAGRGGGHGFRGGQTRGSFYGRGYGHGGRGRGY